MGRGERKEVLAAERELAVGFGVGDEAQHVFDRQTLAALALASAAHAAVERADVLELGGQPFLVIAAEGRGHGLEVFFELIDVRHAGDGGVDAAITCDPLERRQHAAVLFQLLIVGIALAACSNTVVTTGSTVKL